MRRRHPLTRALALTLVISILAGCASTNVPAMGAAGKPFQLATDERQIWQQAEKEEEKLEKSGRLYDDPLLEEYLGRVADHLLPPEVKEAGNVGFRLRVFRDPTLNAFALPNGRIYFHTGLLARLENEAQLATIIAHETTHVTHRHALKFNRDARNKALVFTLAGVAASIGVAVLAGERARRGDPIGAHVLSQTGNVMLGLGLQLSLLAAVNGFGRDLEAEADREGMDRLVKAGYDPKEAPKVFDLLRKDREEQGPVENFFFGSHPRLTERIETTTHLLTTRYAAQAAEPNRVKDGPDFPLRMRTVVRENAALDIRVGRFTLARAQLDRVLALTPRDPTAHLYFGDLHRLQSQRAKDPAEKQRLARLAIERYERAAELDPAFAEPFRQLGFLYYQQREPGRAREAFEKYLALRPDAPDARRIKEYLLELGS
jgi:predicted Zn-dependent protease